MTDTFRSNADAAEIDDAVDLPSDSLERQADSILTHEERAFGTSARETGSIRRAVKQDLEHGRLWASDSAGRVSEVIREEPLKATFYALAAGVFLGLILRR